MFTDVYGSIGTEGRGFEVLEVQSRNLGVHINLHGFGWLRGFRTIRLGARERGHGWVRTASANCHRPLRAVKRRPSLVAPKILGLAAPDFGPQNSKP